MKSQLFQIAITILAWAGLYTVFHLSIALGRLSVINNWQSLEILWGKALQRWIIKKFTKAVTNKLK